MIIQNGNILTNRYNDYLTDNKIIEHGDKYKNLINLSFTSPSAVVSLISGLPENGWPYFEGLDELRK